MGKNPDGDEVTALALDVNVELSFDGRSRYNHRGLRVNILFADSHAATANNQDGVLSIPVVTMPPDESVYRVDVSSIFKHADRK